MSSQLGALLVHIDFSPKTCFFGYFCLDSPLFTNLGYFPAYFPQLLLCYSLYTYFPQETKKKIAEPPEKEETSGALGQIQVIIILFHEKGENNPKNVENFKMRKKFRFPI